ncbi:glycosyltransferase family 1 protein [Chitinophaga sp. CB10]|uniref:glycosyltransferase family 4 protein n=1 Tax=Chitinophaga sp. CB10 TaxID=1891659 RepID=UPI0025C0F891|nr:glycosyltransferase family 1 protein [Chitinophaga sp. CB10]
MKVLYDHQTFTMQEYGGISRYFYELISHGRQDREMEIDVSAWLTNNAYLNKSTNVGSHYFFRSKRFRGKYHIMNMINKTISEKKIGKGNHDIIHPTYYDPYFLNHVKGQVFTATYLDMIHEKFADKFEVLNDKSIFRNKKLLLEKAPRVIAISASTKRDMIDIFGVDGSKIEVIYLGSSFKDDAVNIAERIVINPYILFVGNRSGYKNFDFFVSSIAPIIHKQADLKLIAAGGGDFTDSERELLRQLGIAEQVEQVRINDKVLKNLYKYAEMFVFPSLYEGFGIPVLEAFSLKCPVVVSNRSSLPEIAEEAAVYFDPTDADSIYKAVDNLLGNTAQQQELKRLGTLQEKKFSWEATYIKTKNFYKSLI